MRVYVVSTVLQCVAVCCVRHMKHAYLRHASEQLIRLAPVYVCVRECVYVCA